MGASFDKPSWLKHLDFTVIDLLCLVASFVIAYWIKFGTPNFVQSSQWRTLLILLLLANVVITFAIEPYSGIFRRRYWEDIGANLKLAIFSFLVACVVFYLFKIGEDYSREMLITTYIVYFLASALLKAVWKKILLSRRDNRPADSTKRTLLVTTEQDADNIEQLLYADDMKSSQVVGYCLVDSDKKEFSGKPSSNAANLIKLAAKVNADEVVIATDPNQVQATIYDQLIDDGIRVSFAIEESLKVNSETQKIGRAGVMKTVDLDRYSFGAGQILYLPIKRLCDIFFGIIGCFCSAIIFVIIKLAYLLTGDRHSILYKQQRVGLRGKRFNLWKFRSMVWNADDVLKELLSDPTYKKQWEQGQKLENDPRITKVGKFIRRTSLDEFPQFFNVLRGDMSIVGPRPLIPGELEEHGGRKLYNKVKPGITGWWGCNGRSNIEYRERLELEYHYVKHCSLYLDILCIFRTFVAVIRKNGAQ